MNDKEIKEFILNELLKFKFRVYSKGFKYLVEAIFLCIKNQDYINNLSKYVFPKIAYKHHEKSELNVKWCMSIFFD